MATTFKDFTEMLVMNYRGEDTEEEFTYDPVCFYFGRSSIGYRMASLGFDFDI